MPPLFLIRKTEQRVIYDTDLEVEEGAECLVLATPSRQRRARSFLDHVPRRLSDSAASLNEADSKTRTITPQSSTTNFLTAFNNLISSPEKVSTTSDNSLRPGGGRPRAKTAPDVVDTLDLEALDRGIADAEPHTPHRRKEGRRDDGTSESEGNVPDSLWFRKPRNSEGNSIRTISTWSEHSGAVTPESKPSPPGPLGSSKVGIETNPLKPMVLPLPASQEEMAGKALPMPSWPVSSPPIGLLGPIPPGAIHSPPPTQYPMVSAMPSLKQYRAFSVPTTAPISPPKGQSILRPIGTPAPTSRTPSPTPDKTVEVLRTAHWAHIKELNDQHEKALADVKSAHEEDFAKLEEAHAEEVESLNAAVFELNEAHANELNSLKTHIALLERQATLPRGQHLSPSGLLPLLNTSPSPPLRNSAEFAPATTTALALPASQPLAIVPAVASAAPEIPVVAVNASSGIVDELKASLSTKDKDLSVLKAENSLLKQEFEAKDRRVKQMLLAMKSAAEKENSLKTDMADLKRRLEAANDQCLDYLESLEEAKVKTRTLAQREAALRKEFESSTSRPQTPERGSLELDRTRERLQEVESKRLSLQKILTKERTSKDSLESSLRKARKEVEDAKADLAATREKMARLEEQNTRGALESMGMITIANVLQEGANLSPGTGASPIGRTELLKREVRNLDFDERSQLIAFMERLDERQSSNASAQTENSTDSGDSEKEKKLKTAFRKLELERDQLSALLATEIRRAARVSANSEDIGVSRLERYDSIRSRVGSLASSRTSPTSAEEQQLHSECDKRFEKVREIYEEEVRGLVKEIVLYKLDVKGYKKDLKRASSTITKLKTGSKESILLEEPDMSPAFDDMSAIDGGRGEIPAPLRTRRSTTHLFLEKARSNSRDRVKESASSTPRSTSVDGLGISMALASASSTPAPSTPAPPRPRRQSSQQSLSHLQTTSTPTHPRRPGMNARAMTVETSSPTTTRSSEKSRLGRKDSGLGAKGRDDLELLRAGGGAGGGAIDKSGLLSAPQWGKGDKARAVLGVPLSAPAPTSYGKDRYSPMSDAELGEDELRPLSTVAEVGSTYGNSPA